jgi:hypothetical protein
MRNIVAAVSIVLLVGTVGSREAMGAGQRSFVSGSGVDVGTCTLVAPCRSFGYAIAQTLAGGEVIVLDSAGYGPVTIGKAIMITAPPGIYAGISVFSESDGVTITAGAADTVVLRGLTIIGLAGGLGNGINAAAAKFVRVERCSIGGFGLGILYYGIGVDSMVIADSELHDNFVGIRALGAGLSGRLEIVRTQVQGGAGGLDAVDLFRTVVSDSLFARSSQTGINLVLMGALSGNASLAIERTVIVDNLVYGLAASSNAAQVPVVNVVNSTISGNGTGVLAGSNGYIRVAGTQINGNSLGVSPNGGSVMTLGTNMLYGNSVNGTFTGSLPPN